ncbi:MAG: urease accessory protein UreD [Ktedonobacterales bacterium]
MEGRLRLVFESQSGDGQTRMRVIEQTPPLRVIRALALGDGASLVHLHNVSGGVLGGDHLALEVEAQAGSHVQLTTTGATRIYRCAEGVSEAVQLVNVRVCAGALLEYLPDALIPFAGARYRQHTSIELADDAGLFWWEVVAPGREARGERFAYEALRLSLDLHANGIPIAMERQCIEPRRHPVASQVRLGRFSYYATFYVCRVGTDPACWAGLEVQLAQLTREMSVAGETVWGVSTLTAHGLSVRGLSSASTPLVTGLQTFWSVARRALYGREAVPPRKLY